MNHFSMLAVIACLALSAVPIHALAGDRPKAPNAPIVLENAHVRLSIDPLHGGLASLRDLASGTEHIQPHSDTPSLWRVCCTNDGRFLRFSNAQNPCTSTELSRTWRGAQRLTLRWSDIGLEQEQSALDVEVTVELPKDSGIASWRIRVRNRSAKWGLRELDFPRVTGFLEDGRYDLAGTFGHTETWGSLYTNYSGRMSMRYPDGWRGMSAQFICATREGSSVYMAAHDGRAWFKDFVIEPGEEYYIRTYAENVAVPGADYLAPYPAMLGVYQGSWFAGCKIYRAFAVTAPWTSKGRVSQRKAAPRSIEDIGLWLREWDWTINAVGDVDEKIRQAREARDYFGVPLGFHWYNWQVHDFDTKYPHMFPAKPGADRLCRAMVDMGFVVMPYINGRIVDKSNSDFANLAPYAARDDRGKVFTERYGNFVRQAPMCPYTQAWQDTVASNVERLVTGFGANAVYIDQISAGPPYLCFDKTHGHPLGGGSWWVDGYRQMLKKVQAVAHAKGRNVIITSECTAEPFMDGLDAFLTINERTERSIPVLPAVYSGYTLYFGDREDALRDLSDHAWILELGRDFLWGCQNGWFGFNLFRPENAAKRAYFKELGNARVAGKKYLVYGELVGLFDDGSKSDHMAIPYVQGSIWKAEDGALGVIVLNGRDQSREVSCSLDPQAYGLASRTGYQCSRVYPERGLPETCSSGVIALKETLRPLEIRILEINRAP